MDIDGAVFPRLLPWEGYDLMSADFRFGIPITYGGQRVQTKLEFYHISSHVGDEYIFAHPGTQTDDYTWDGIGWGLSWYVNENLRLYEEIDYGYGTGGPAKPLEFQFGVDFSPVWTFGSRRRRTFSGDERPSLSDARLQRQFRAANRLAVARHDRQHTPYGLGILHRLQRPVRVLQPGAKTRSAWASGTISTRRAPSP